MKCLFRGNCRPTDGHCDYNHGVISRSAIQQENLLTVMIVDDEPMAIEYLRNMIEWPEHGYRIVAEATDTSCAIEAFRQNRPRIVLSDIRIPGVDGLDMCRELLKTDPSVKIILVTAYSEFNYAKKAMESGIHQYVLKHEISEKRLLEELEKARREIQREANENRILARSVITDSIAGRRVDPRLTGSKRKILEKIGKTVILLLLKEYSPFVIWEEFELGREEDEELRGVIRTLPLSEGYRYIDRFRTEHGIEAYLIAHEESLSADVVERNLEPLLRKHVLERNCRSYSAVIITDGLGLGRLAENYRKAVRLFDGFSFLEGSNLAFLPKRAALEPEGAVRTDIEADLAATAEHLEVFDFQEAIRAVRRLFGYFVHPETQSEVLRTTIRRLIDVVDGWALENHLIPMDRVRLEGCRSVDDLCGVCIGAIEDMSLEFDSVGPDHSSKISKAILYINKNYSRNLSVAEIAEELGISESNLSKSFRQEIGKSVLDYLTGVRIKVAKRLLVRTSLKIYQIAEMTGYSTSGYFGRVFLKETRMAPLEYRTVETRENE